ncbi:MAG: hybrid sensor histidine kinase/response regulator [Chloroflexota bacterium]
MSDTDLLNIFWEEASEHLETLNNTLLQVEMLSDADDADRYRVAVKEMNRVAHSLKGAARAVGINVIETVSHYMEEVFAAVMNNKLQLTPDVADLLYDGLDIIQSVADGTEIAPDAVRDVLARLEGVVVGAAGPERTREIPSVDFNTFEAQPPPAAMRSALETPAIQPVTSAPEPDKPPAAETRPGPTVPDTGTVLVRQVEESVRVTVSKLDRLMAEVTELFVARMHGEEQLRAIAQLRQSHARWQREWRSVRTAYIRLVRRLQEQQASQGSELQTIFRFLEYNQRALSEANRMLSALAHTATQDNLRLGALADQLQDEIGALRLIPFDSVVGMFQRMVRDLARDIGKQVALEIDGAGVEIDKAVLEALKDPLMHLLRNAVDHGIEAPEIRMQSDKPPAGRITVGVEQRGSEIVIRVADDGRGIDAEAVRRSAVRQGLLTEPQAAALADDEVRTYIFYSGLSTSEQVTTISGRGMGMDIVRDRVESLRGRVSVSSKVGAGTVVTLNVPVSLVRLRCVIMHIGEQRFAVPSAMVTRMDTLGRDSIFTAEGRDMLRINELPLPLVSLASVLEIPAVSVGDQNPFKVVALQATDRAVAFEVDNLESEVELVLKPLGRELARARFVSGAALMGTGEVIIVLDANDLVRRATGARLPVRRPVITTPSVERGRIRVLVVDDSITTRTLEKNILETAGFDVSTAMDGVEAWNLLSHDVFDVIISDVEMPNMNGLELCARIKTSEQYGHIPVVLLTSLGKPEQREAGLKAGADAYLIKARFDQGELLETILAVVP